MNLESIAQSLIFGAFNGGIYGLAAIGLAMVFGVLKVLNVAHGELLMLGGTLSFWLFDHWGMDPFLSLILVVPALFAFGLLLDRSVYRYVVRQTGAEKIKNSLLVSFGLTLVIQNLAIRLFSADERGIQVPYAGEGLSIVGVSLPYARLASLLLALLAALALRRFLHGSFFGKAILATAEDWEAAELAGINIQHVYMMTFALGASLAAAAGTLVTVTYGIAPAAGLGWTLKALIVIVLAGTGSIFGTIPAGMLLGIVESLSGTLFGASYQEVIGLLMFLAVLMLRPQGLFARRE
jgi:branched-chain amino acid transport system permease protein